MMNTRLMNILQSFVVTEKSQNLANSNNCYTVKVLADATKPEIKAAVEATFNVHVLSVNTANYAGKKRRTARGYGVRSDWKKAYVTIEQDQKIELYQADKESN